jgi:hypothetical protein
MRVTFFQNTIETVRAINRRYKTPHMKTTRLVRVCLGLLRFYLLLLVGILVLKFLQALHS